MSDLITRLSAKLDDIKQAATSCGTDPDHARWLAVSASVGSDADALHILRHGPASVLRLIEAHRKILALHKHQEMRFEAIARITSIPALKVPYLACEVCAGRDDDGDLIFGGNEEHCATIQYLAEGYGIKLEEGTST